MTGRYPSLIMKFKNIATFFREQEIIKSSRASIKMLNVKRKKVNRFNWVFEEMCEWDNR